MRALLYARVSWAEQARRGVSLPAQVARCRAYAAAQGWAPAEPFWDVGSGARDDRPGYRALLAEARRRRAAGEGAAVVVAALDRLGRRMAEQVRRRDELAAPSACGLLPCPPLS